MSAVAAPTLADKKELAEELRLLDVRDECWNDPKALVNEIRYFDPVTQLWVEFTMFPPEGWESPISELPNGDLRFTEGAQDWFWQAQIIDWMHDPELHAYLIYKARQLGITLLACAYALWLMLYRPGTSAVAYSYEEGEAKKLVEAAWSMFTALPDVLKQHVEVVTPSRRDIPAEWIKLRHADGRLSTFQALPATERHGHGARVTFGIMDEVAKQKYARRVYEGIGPATLSRGGKLVMISTADGVSNPETGEGNFFHHMYVTRREKGLSYVFLPWNAEPTRDAEWYQRVAMKLPDVERNRQYPLNERDGFILSGALYFEREALEFYDAEIIDPLFCGQFVQSGRREAKFMRLRDGVIDIFEKPKLNGQYVIGVDTSTGRAGDYTSADVLDLSSGALVAHMHAKMEAPRTAFQLFYLGYWYNEAKIGVERQGGYGEAVIYGLRDGDKNRPGYSNLYRHRQVNKPGKPRKDEFGYPMGPADRNRVLEQLRDFVRRRLFPWLSAGHVDELMTFVYAETAPSPRAQDGCNDDRVMSLALGADLYQQFGDLPARPRTSGKRGKTGYRPPPTRQV